MVGDSCELWLLGALAWKGVMGWGWAAVLAAPSPLAWGASASPHAEEASAEHPSPRARSPRPGLLASARRSPASWLSHGQAAGGTCPAATGQGCDTAMAVARGQGGTLDSRSSSVPLSASAMWCPGGVWRSTELERGSQPTLGGQAMGRVPWLWHEGLSVGLILVTLSLPPSWLWEGMGKAAGAPCPAVWRTPVWSWGTSDKDGGPLSARSSFFFQDYMDALMTNYCVSAGTSVSLSLSRLLHGAAMGSVGHPECQAGVGVGQGPWQGSSPLLLFSAQIWPPVQIANFYFVPLQHR